MAGITGSGCGLRGRVALWGLLGVLLLPGGPARADWKAYVSADFGISNSKLNTDGVFDDAPPITFGGEDQDASPLVGGALGIEVPMDELLPREWLLDVRLPRWPVRLEVEGAGLREYEFQTVGSGASAESFFTDVEAATLLFNVWLDMPLQDVYRPFQYLFGLGRQPTVRRLLEPASLYLGTGIGVGFLDVRGTDNLFRVSDGLIDFAWNAGAGINYAVTDSVTLAGGYRYLGLADAELDFLTDATTPGPNDTMNIDQEIHEFRFTVRVAYLEFLSPWR